MKGEMCNFCVGRSTMGRLLNYFLMIFHFFFVYFTSPCDGVGDDPQKENRLIR